MNFQYIMLTEINLSQKLTYTNELCIIPVKWGTKSIQIHREENRRLRAGGWMES